MGSREVRDAMVESWAVQIKAVGYHGGTSLIHWSNCYSSSLAVCFPTTLDKRALKRNKERFSAILQPKLNLI